MEPIPDCWPESTDVQVAPLFPLPNVFLFPGCVMSLHIFEPRYRQMIEDLLDGSGRLVIGTIVDDKIGGLAQHPGLPCVCDVGGLGEIGRHERLPDGRFLIWLIGLTRVRVREIVSDRMYRKVAVEALEESGVHGDHEAQLRERLHKAILARCTQFLNLPDDMPLSYSVDLLLQRMQLPQAVMRKLYCELDVEKRARQALLEHARCPLPPPGKPAN